MNQHGYGLLCLSEVKWTGVASVIQCAGLSGGGGGGRGGGGGVGWLRKGRGSRERVRVRRREGSRRWCWGRVVAVGDVKIVSLSEISFLE